MTYLPPSEARDERRVVLIDFDWQDADLMPRLLRQSGIRIHMVAGAREDDVGVRVAELCGVPRSTDIADLTREIFDLALVSERSSRRPQIERLLMALGTPVASPQSFLDRAHPAATNGTAGSNGQHATQLSELLVEALPDLSQPQPGIEREEWAAAPLSDALPGPDDRAALERLLERWTETHGARAAQLTIASNRPGEQRRLGSDDALLETLVRLALDDDAAHVVSRLDGPDRGRAWGAWPFRTRRHHGVLAAAAIEAVDGRATWERMAQELRVAWEGLEHARSGAQDPLQRRGWIAGDEMRARLEPACERNRDLGQRSTLHRLRFGGVVESADVLCRDLPAALRETDAICRVGPHEVLLLTVGTAAGFVQIRRRLAALWDDAWIASGARAPAPPIADEYVELIEPEDAEVFRAVARDWLSGV